MEPEVEHQRQVRAGLVRSASDTPAAHLTPHPRLCLARHRRSEVQKVLSEPGNEAYEQFKERRRAAGGRRVGGPPKPYRPPQVPDGKVNLTDPDSKRLKAREGTSNSDGRRFESCRERCEVAGKPPILMGALAWDFGGSVPNMSRTWQACGNAWRPAWM